MIKFHAHPFEFIQCFFNINRLGASGCASHPNPALLAEKDTALVRGYIQSPLPGLLLRAGA